ncbi:MAG TPA: NADH-dependent alcohol dehydrogenase, partial [Sutterella sp.]|nr:NADH-dependent alcohol dehydrogenase [Sutterella sp.]
TQEAANAGLEALHDWMREIGVDLTLTDLGVKEEMLEKIADGVFILKGGYKVLTREEVIAILRASL